MPLMVSVSGVRGIVGPELNPVTLSRWIAAFASLQKPGPIVLGRDSRPTGEALSAACVGVLCAMGREVWDLGIVPTPTVQLAVERWGAVGGLILTASHNPVQWNALKFVDSDGSFLSPERFADLKRLHEASEGLFVAAREYGSAADRHRDALDLHLAAVVAAIDADRVRAASIRAALDCGHGAGGTLLPRLAAELGVTLDAHNVEPSGQFAENPEPTADTLKLFLKLVAPDVAFAAMVDPDADRFAVALPGTGAASEEWTLPLVARSILGTRPGPLVTNLSTSTRLEAVAERFGVPVFRAPVGEAHVVGEMKRRGAVLGGEGNGGVIDPQVHFGRDSAVAFARLCEAEAIHPGGLRALAAELPPRFMRKAKLPIPERGLKGLERELAAFFGEPDDRRDGWRWDRPNGFVHVRASNTEPIVRAVVEGGSEEQVRELLDLLGRAVA